MSELSRSAQIVQEALQAKGFDCEVKELPDTTRSAKDAAKAIDCTVKEIAKSIVFQGVETGEPVLVIASGINRINEDLICEALGQSIEVASPDFVREATGFAIGGVPPVGHKTTVRTFIDQDLLQLDTIWAAAGTPFAVFQTTPSYLVEITNGVVLNVVK